MGASLSKMTCGDLRTAVAPLGKAPFFAEFSSWLDDNDVTGELVLAAATDMVTFTAFLDMLVESGCPQPNKIQALILFTATKEKKSDAASTPSEVNDFIHSNVWQYFM
jgi:hypothetical protein